MEVTSTIHPPFISVLHLLLSCCFIKLHLYYKANAHFRTFYNKLFAEIQLSLVSTCMIFTEIHWNLLISVKIQLQLKSNISDFFLRAFKPAAPS